jgi:uncharacterized repeat protein (TIGR03803 family)
MREASLKCGRVAILIVALLAIAVQAQTYTVLYTFTGGADGGYPQYTRLVMDAAGNLYGTTPFGGDVNCPLQTYPGPGCGVVFKLDPAGNETVLYTFTDGADGAQPWGGVVLDNQGNLYGTAVFGGSFGAGVIYKVDPSGNQTVLHAFERSDGANPSGDLLQDSSGNLYGTTITGGNLTSCRGAGCGVIFKENPSAGIFEVLHRFTGLANPTHPLIRDAGGNLYATTENGGSLDCVNYEGFEALQTGVPGCGGVFKFSTASTGREAPLYLFGGYPDGSDSRAPLILDSAGDFYGTTFYGGLYGAGTVFKLDGTGHETILYNFLGSTDGANPWSGLAADAQGNLYGTTNHAGGGCYCGTVYKLDAHNNFSVLHTFTGADGQYPEAPLLLYNGALYGITSSGGSPGTGTIFKITLQ